VVDDARQSTLRWRLADEDAAAALFPDETVRRRVGTGAYAGLEFLEVNARSIVNTLPPASALPFRHTINAYRGCSHACTYCFARPTHTYLGLGIDRDFERRIVVKVNAVERLRAELRAPAWRGEPIAMGTNTDPYQAAEGKYHLTQGIIGELTAARNPFSILTKSTLVLRDLRQLAEAAGHTDVRCDLSIGTLDRDVWRATEPGTPPPEHRLRAVARLNEAGIPCGVLVAPVLPGLSDGDEQIRAVAEAAIGAGAVSVTAIPLHLRPGVRDHYLAWLRGARPDLVALTARRFRSGSYQSRAEQDRVSRLVQDTLRRHPGAPAGRPEPFGHVTRVAARAARAPATTRPVATPAPTEQLRLL
jgi:DNA repair photolyase